MKKAADFKLLSARGAKLTGCLCADEDPQQCACIPAEKAVRYLGLYGGHVAFVLQEREEMLQELQRLGQSRVGYQSSSIDEVARALLCAWVDNSLAKGSEA